MIQHQLANAATWWIDKEVVNKAVGSKEPRHPDQHLTITGEIDLFLACCGDEVFGKRRTACLEPGEAGVQDPGIKFTTGRNLGSPREADRDQACMVQPSTPMAA